MLDRFRKWYDYERDANAKTLVMLDSVPAENRSDPQYAKALTKMAHCVVARQMWLFRLGVGTAPTALFPEVKSPAEIAAMLAPVEAAWTAYYQTLTEADLAREFEYTGWDKKNYRLSIEALLTQLFGHAWYHRGQIASIVAGLGGKFVDTDYILWPGAGRVAL
ncbi:hypothetical protein BH11PLA2_BH11PLA2_14780 [soil metagenome]